MKNKWYPFNSLKGSRQKRPPERKHVLVKLSTNSSCTPEGVAVGYMKNAAGDKQSLLILSFPVLVVIN